MKNQRNPNESFYYFFTLEYSENIRSFTKSSEGFLEVPRHRINEFFRHSLLRLKRVLEIGFN